MTQTKPDCDGSGGYLCCRFHLSLIHFHRVRSVQCLVHIIIEFVNHRHGRLQSHHMEKPPTNLIQRHIAGWVSRLHATLHNFVEYSIETCYRISRRQPTYDHQPTSVSLCQQLHWLARIVDTTRPLSNHKKLGLARPRLSLGSGGTTFLRLWGNQACVRRSDPGQAWQA
jgi:hypothetical protein